MLTVPSCRVVHPLTILLAGCILFHAGSASAGPPIAVEALQRSDAVSFEQEILPLLRRNCLACHSAAERQGGLILETPASILKGGDSGPAAIPGKGLESLMLKLAAHQQEPVMPPEGNDVAAVNLTPGQLGLLRLWIDQGVRGSGGIDSLSPKGLQAVSSRLQAVQAVAITADGQYVALGRGNRIQLHHVPTGQLVATLGDPAAGAAADPQSAVAHRDLVQSLAFNADGDLLASGGFREIKLWRRPKDVRRATIPLPAAPAALAVSPDRQWLAVGCADHTVRLFRFPGGEAGPVLQGHAGAVTALRFATGQPQLLSASADQSVRIWNLPDGVPLGRIETPTALTALEIMEPALPVSDAAAAASPAASADPVLPAMLVTAGGDNLLRLWQLPVSGPLPAAELPAGIAAVAFSDDRRHAAISDASGQLTVLEQWGADGRLRPRALASWKCAAVPKVLSIGLLPGVAGVPTENAAAALQVFAGFESGLLQLRPVADPGAVREWSAGAVGITAADLSMDGRLAASAAADGSEVIWNIGPAATALPTFEAAAEENYRSAQISPSRRLLATVAQQNAQLLLVRSTETGKITARLSGHTGAIAAFAISADEGRLVSAAADGTLRFWDLRNPGQPELKKIESLPGMATAVGVSSDGAQAAVAFADNIVRLYSAGDGMLLKEFSGHTAAVLDLSFRGGQICSIGRDATVRFWNPADGSQARAFNLPGAPSAVAFTPDGQRLLAASENRVSLHQLDNGSAVFNQEGLPGASTSVSISADARLFSLLLPGGQVQVRELAAGRLQEIFTDAQTALSSFALSPTAIVTGRTGTPVEYRSLLYAASPTGNPASPVRGLQFHPNGQLLVSVHADGTLRGVNPAGAAVSFSTSHGAAVNHLSMSADGQLFTTSGENAVLRIWNTGGQPAGPRELPGFPGPIRSSAFSGDGKFLIAAAAGAAPVVRLYDAAAGTLLQQTTISGDVPFAAMFAAAVPAAAGVNANSPVGSRVRPPEVLLVGVQAAWQWQPEFLGVLTGHTGVVHALTRLPGATPQLMSGGADNTVRIWNAGDGQVVRQVNHGGPVFAVAATPDGQRFATASDNRTARLWNVNGNQMAELRGDIRRSIALIRARQSETAANARVNIARQQLDVAEKDLPVRTEAEKKATEALAAAAADMQTKQSAVETTLAAKTASEKTAIEASAASRLALSEKLTAEQAAKTAAAAVQMLQARVNRLQQAAAADPSSETLKQKVAAAQAEMEAAGRKSTELTAAVQAPTAKATEMAAKANEVAQKLDSVQKPYNDAVAALKTSIAAHRLTTQQQALAAAELKTAQELVPVRREVLTRSEAVLAEAKAAVQTADEQLRQSEQPLRSITFSPDGTTLLTAGDFPSLHTWDATVGTAIDALAGHTGVVRAAHYADERLIVSISDDNSVVIWDSKPSWELARTIGAAGDPELIAHRVTSVEFSADASLLLAAGGIPSRRGELQVFSVADGSRKLHLPQAHDDVIYAARFSPDGRRIASASADKYIRTFDASSGELLRRFEGHTSYVLGVSWKRDGQTLVSAGADNSIKVWTAETADQERTISNFDRPVTAVSYIGETDQIVCVSGDKSVRMYNAANGGQIRNFAGADSWQHAVAATPDNAVVVAGGAAGVVRLWNGNNGQQLRELK